MKNLLPRYSNHVIYSLEAFKPLPKATPRKITHTKRHMIKSAVLTDIPIKDEIAVIEASSKVKTMKKDAFNQENKKYHIRKLKRRCHRKYLFLLVLFQALC